MHKKLLSCGLMIFGYLQLSSYSLFSQAPNRPVPAPLYSYHFEKTDNLNHGNILATIYKNGVPIQQQNAISAYPCIFDSDGYLMWYSQTPGHTSLDFKYYPQSGQYSFLNVIAGQQTLRVLDSNLDLEATFTAQNTSGDTHEFFRTENGNWIYMTKYVTVVDLSAYTINNAPGDSATVIRGIGLQEIDASGTLIFEWNSNDYIHPTDFYDEYNYNVNDFDYNHGNAVAEDDDGNLLISFRHLNAIYKINRTTGEVIWILGGKSSDFTFTDNDFFSGQHYIRKQQNGNYSLFDNGNMSPNSAQTRGVEYSLDTVNWIATKSFEIIHPDEFYSRAMGNFSYLPNDEYLLGYGFVNRPFPSATIFDAQKNIVQQFFFEDSVMSYRFQHGENISIDRPIITCNESGGALQLSGPVGASSYLWSTGETTQTIIINEADTIMLWTPYGIGMAGSLPYIVTSNSNNCNLSLDQLITSKSNLDFSYFDMMGRKITVIKPNILYIKLYEDGTSEKVIVLD